MASIAYRIINGVRDEAPVRAVDEAIRIAQGFYVPDDVVEYVCCGIYERTKLPCPAKLQLVSGGKKRKAYFRLIREGSNHHLPGCKYNFEEEALTVHILSSDLSKTDFTSFVKDIFIERARPVRKKSKKDHDGETTVRTPRTVDEDTVEDRITIPRPRGAKTLGELYRISYQNEGDTKFKDGSSVNQRIILRDTIMPFIKQETHLNDYAMVVVQKSRDSAVNDDIFHKYPELREWGELLWVVTDPYFIDPRRKPSLYFVLSFGSNSDLWEQCKKKLTSPTDNKGLFLILCRWEDKGVVGDLRIIKGRVTTPKQIEALPLLESVEPQEYFR